MKYRFQPSQKVFIKSRNKKGHVSGYRVTIFDGLVYTVAYRVHNCVDYDGLASDCVGFKWIYIDTKEDDLTEIDSESIVSKIDCECGKEKHGFASHSRWCPKHV